ncbi:MAG: FISUMP domain-containing protein [Bacteroidales bacterium]|jgi:uncharacterized protein (TIGR02145 family)|nr:FISUMP domain-containing protein [Bacteroidales bacterium]
MITTEIRIKDKRIVRIYKGTVVYRLASMSKYLPQTRDYYERVTLDLGTVRYLEDVNNIYKFLKDESLYTDTKLLWFGDAGIKTRETTVANTPLTFVSKGYSLDPTPNDLTQTTELNQPYLSGNIAPNERYGVKVLNSSVKTLTHPTISFDATSPWSFTLVFEYHKNSSYSTSHERIFGVGTYESAIYLFSAARLTVYNSNYFEAIIPNQFNFNRKLIGKNQILTVIGDGNKNCKVYFNGELLVDSTGSNDTNFSFTGFNPKYVDITYDYYRIQSGAMTAPQVAAEHSMLRSIYPEIESVQIGTQTWATSNLEMVATPMGNVIPEVQDNADWVNAINLYNTAIADGKTEAEAVKAAAMWCYYDNDPNIGAVYGKLYNWYAAKLIQNDIDAYNAANPTEPWGWRVPTLADWNTLTNSVSEAGDLCVPDTYFDNYYGAGTNSSGLSLLGGGQRLENGDFWGLREFFLFQAINETNSTRYIAPPSLYGTETSETAVLSGVSIRLIKDE